ncbi:MAG: TolC family protein, partial [Tenuifilaceae bacterium]
MKRYCFITINLACALLLNTLGLSAQSVYTLQQCLEYAVENNRNLKKSQYDREKAAYARQEVLGTLLPQINGTANLNDNLKKAKFIMPNFMNSMLPPPAQDPNAPKYMTIEMGTNFNANVGVSLSQQLLNFSLFNMLDIAKTAEKMAELSIESGEEDVIYQTANLFYAIQSTEYAVDGIEKSIELVRKMLATMEVNYANGLVKKIDVDRLRVNLVNLTTQKNVVRNAADIQKNLLKLQMGFDMESPIAIEPIRTEQLVDSTTHDDLMPFAPENLTPYRLLMERMNMVKLQKKSAV